MTPKQMYRAMRRYHIAVVHINGVWYAGHATVVTRDACNARDLEWDS